MMGEIRSIGHECCILTTVYSRVSLTPLARLNHAVLRLLNLVLCVV